VSELGGGSLAIVGAPYTTRGQPAGTVGIIGPTRMDYPRVLPLVAATASAMSAYMQRTEVDARGEGKLGAGAKVGKTEPDDED
jgi:heat-inducible transcriptional repressor